MRKFGRGAKHDLLGYHILEFFIGHLPFYLQRVNNANMYREQQNSRAHTYVSSLFGQETKCRLVESKMLCNHRSEVLCTLSY